MRGITILFALGIVAVAGAFLIFLSDLVPYSGSDAYFRQPAFFPAVMLGALVVVGLALTVKYAAGLALPVDEELSGTSPHLTILAILGAIFALYILAVPYIGYLPSTLVFGIAALASGRHLKISGIVAILALAVVLYLVFVYYLDVWFPGGDFPLLELFS